MRVLQAVFPSPDLSVRRVPSPEIPRPYKHPSRGTFLGFSNDFLSRVSSPTMVVVWWYGDTIDGTQNVPGTK